MSLKNIGSNAADFLVQTNYAATLGDFTASATFYWDGNTTPFSGRIIDKNFATSFLIYRQGNTTNLTGGVVVPAAPTGTVSTTIPNGSWATVTLRRSGTAVDLFLDNAKTSITGVSTVMGTDRMYFGNVAAASNAWMGNIMRPAVWSVALTDDEINTYVKGFSPTKIRPDSLDIMLPMIVNDIIPWKAVTNGGAGTWAVDSTRAPRIYGYI